MIRRAVIVWARRALVLPLLIGAGGAGAQTWPLPDFQTCIDIVTDTYEWRLSTIRATPLDELDNVLWQMRGTYYCGSVGIVLCDLSDAPLSCQRDFAAEQAALTAQVLTSLDAPEEVAEPGFAHLLYASSYALAHGSSAGPDCAGAGEVMAAWCEAREANNQLQVAMLAWQVGRYLGKARPAIEAGWANQPPPVRPRARPAR